MKRIAVVLLAGCGFTSPSASGDDGGTITHDGSIDAAGGAWLTGYHYRKPIAITPAAALDNFVVGLVRTKDPDIAAHANVHDLVVTADDAVTPLESEYVTSTIDGTIEIWVRTPHLAAAPQTIFLYYGGPTVQGTSAMWSQLAAIWHLSDVGLEAADSGPAGHNLSASGASAVPQSRPGIAGAARQYDGVDDSYGIADPNDLDMAVSSFSYTMWLNVASPDGAFDTPFWKGGTSNSEPGFCILTGNGSWYAKIHDGSHFADPKLGDQSALANKWVHVAAVVDRTAQTFTTYTNGVFANVQSTQQVGSISNSLAFDLGRPAGNFPFKGMLDEVRIYRSALTPAWIAAEHANLSDPTFVVFGDEQMR